MPPPPLTLVARLGKDLNWWADVAGPPAPRAMTASILDPRQLAHLVQACARYQPHGLRPEQLASAFHLYAVQSEIQTGGLRLVHNPAARPDDAADLFALPALEEDGDGPCPDFLDALIAARVRQINATGHHVSPVTADELRDQLDALDNERYFRGSPPHLFDQITEILQWDPTT